MLLEVEHLSVSVQSSPILVDVNLKLAPGTIYGLLGPNGAGKSTTVAAILGLIPVKAGTISLFGTRSHENAAKIRARIGVLPEHNGFYDWMAAADYLEYFASLYGMRLTEGAAREHLARVGLEKNAAQIIATFSHGMRKRLGLARALLPDPRLIILDEPTNGLDPAGRRQLHDLLSDLARKGAGILLCTHLLDDVERLCDKLGIIMRGRTVIEGSIRDLTGQGDKSRFQLRLTRPPPEAKSMEGLSVLSHDQGWWTVEIGRGLSPELVWQGLLSRGWPITEIRNASRTIEDVYLSLTEDRRQ